MHRKNIAIFASGTGSNAEKLMEHFKTHPKGKVVLLLSNREEAKVIKVAEKYRVPAITFSKKELYEENTVLDLLQKYEVNIIVLAGFLWLIPLTMIRKYENKIINIHPALLPKYGGKGMYGNKVHETVLGSGDKESGISIHYVNEKFDEGRILFQAKCKIDEKDTLEALANKVQLLEHLHYPKVIEQLL